MHLPPELFAELRAAYPDSDEIAWRLPNRPFPVSVTDTEGQLLAHAILQKQLCSGYEVATGFGLSSLWAGTALKETGGTLISIDTYREETTQDFETTGSGVAWEPYGLLFAMRWRDRLHFPLRYAIAASPVDVPSLGLRHLDYVFIDGCHYGAHPLKDVAAVVPYLASRGIMAFHDAQLVSVQKAISFIKQLTHGRVIEHETRHQLTFVEWGGWELYERFSSPEENDQSEGA